MSRGQRIAREKNAIQRRAAKKAARRRARRAAMRPGAAVTAAAAALTLTSLPQAEAAGPYTAELVSVVRSARDLTAVGGRLFFTANTFAHGRELWTSNGTAGGTALLKDLTPGEDDGYPEQLTAVGGTLFFTAFDSKHGRELWKSDGTAAGTVLVKDINPGGDRGAPEYLTAVGGLLYFTVYDGVNGRELWKSDGTAAGTVLVKNTSPKTRYRYGPSDLVGVGGTLYFTADNGTSGRELWKSDGTTAGTALLKDINPDGGYGGYYDSSYPRQLTAVGSTLFFTARTDDHGRELWKSNGTTASTVLVEDININGYYGTDSSQPQELTAVGNTLFFTANDGVAGDELWKSDGTAAGTVLIEDIDPGGGSYYYDGPEDLTAVGGTVYFTADDGVAGQELWKSDGTPAGTSLVRDIDPGVDSSDVDELVASGGALFFTADDLSNTKQIWTSDGSAAGTVPVTTFAPSEYYGYTADPTDVAGTLFFTASDDENGDALWKVVSGSPPAPTCNGLTATITGSGTINGTAGADVIVGSSGADSINGLGGNDTICAGDGDDKISQGSAADGADRVDGEGGTDTITYGSRTAVVTLTLGDTSANDGASGESDRVLNVENAFGGTGNDSLTGSSVSNQLIGGSGNDVIDGGTGDDDEQGGVGDDTFVQGNAANGGDSLKGQTGVDTITYASRFVGVTVTMGDGLPNDGATTGEGDNLSAIENINGTGKSDIITGDGADNLINGGAGGDRLIGNGGADTVNGEDGNDALKLKDNVGGNDTGDGGDGTADSATFDAGDTVLNVP